MRNSFIDEWHGREVEFRSNREELAGRMRGAIAEGTVHELLVVAGEAAGAIDEILPAAD